MPISVTDQGTSTTVTDAVLRNASKDLALAAFSPTSNVNRVVSGGGHNYIGITRYDGAARRFETYNISGASLVRIPGVLISSNDIIGGVFTSDILFDVRGTRVFIWTISSTGTFTHRRTVTVPRASGAFVYNNRLYLVSGTNTAITASAYNITGSGSYYKHCKK